MGPGQQGLISFEDFLPTYLFPIVPIICCRFFVDFVVVAVVAVVVAVVVVVVSASVAVVGRVQWP
jgi:hypothetical protein